MKFQQNGIQVAIQPLLTLKLYRFLKAINELRKAVAFKLY